MTNNRHRGKAVRWGARRSTGLVTQLFIIRKKSQIATLALYVLCFCNTGPTRVRFQLLATIRNQNHSPTDGLESSAGQICAERGEEEHSCTVGDST